MRCWGDNYYGQLGYGDNINRNSPGANIPLNTTLNLNVTFDGLPATGVTFVNSTQLTAITPSHPAGFVNVVIYNGDGNNITLNSGYEYVSITNPITNTNVSCVITTDTNLLGLSGSVNIRIGAGGAVINCPVTGSGNTLICNNIPVGGTAGTFASQYNASGSGSTYLDANNITVTTVSLAPNSGPTIGGTGVTFMIRLV
jgi:hypothetical protein